MENNFQAVQMTLRNLPNDYSVMIDMDVPKDSLARVEKAHGDKTLAAEIDKIHGLEAIHRSDVLHSQSFDRVYKLTIKKQAKIIRMDVSLAPEPFKSQKDTRTLELLEKRLIELEMRERARSIDIKVLMEELKSFQIEYYGRLEAMEKKLDEKLEGLQSKCERLAGVVVRYKVAPATVAPSTETDQVAQAAEN